MYTGWGLVDRNFGHVDLVNKALGLVNKPKCHFEMACMLLMTVPYILTAHVNSYHEILGDKEPRFGHRKN